MLTIKKLKKWLLKKKNGNGIKGCGKYYRSANLSSELGISWTADQQIDEMTLDSPIIHNGNCYDSECNDFKQISGSGNVNGSPLSAALKPFKNFEGKKWFDACPVSLDSSSNQVPDNYQEYRFSVCNKNPHK